MRFARRAMLVAAVVLPPVETIRRWNVWRENPTALFDDYVIAAMLLWVAWLTRRERIEDRAYLAAMIGFAGGCAMMSTLSSVYQAQVGQIDPSGFSAVTVALVKASIVVLCAVGLASVLRHRPTN